MLLTIFRSVWSTLHPTNAVTHSALGPKFRLGVKDLSHLKVTWRKAPRAQSKISGVDAR